MVGSFIARETSRDDSSEPGTSSLDRAIVWKESRSATPKLEQSCRVCIPSGFVDGLGNCSASENGVRFGLRRLFDEAVFPIPDRD
jgi:hypothetical protein